MHVAWLDMSATKVFAKHHPEIGSGLRLECPIKGIDRRDIPKPIESQVVKTNIDALEGESGKVREPKSRSFSNMNSAFSLPFSLFYFPFTLALLLCHLSVFFSSFNCSASIQDEHIGSN